ncbi:sensor histidine kinase [Streptomyces venezuelae]|uniref:Sensor histidine kinase n=1 Tax=Streptomyces venezuelae TaxID=54571 RepID=A0A5P2D1L6_STRVZ|nr:histidine kinase [Streptomyces venezuelae]QES49032.1 sensor histidine kinase [Streptomyces venezuelae]
MSKLTGWWSGLGSAAKVELYTRWSFHSFALVEVTAIGLGSLAGSRQPVAADLVAAAFVLAHAVLSAVVSSRALDWLLDRAERPVRPALALALVSGAATLYFLFLHARQQGDGSPADPAPTLVTGVVVFGLGSLTLCLRRMRRMVYLAPAAAVVTGLGGLAVGVPFADSVGYMVGLLFGCALITFTCGFSAWLVKTVWELDRSRELGARLAVAEERLRFGRDMHDVMGRNLAVIALKSELAVQLARRGRPEAVDQMVEVQRIAQESQREVRDVVRGYREADLAVELDGARGVLRAAGIDCRVELRDRRELPAPVQSALGWVVREGTTNVLRHGDARSCVIRLAPEDEGEGTAEDGGKGLGLGLGLALVIENDGVPAGPAGRDGSGLAGLRERLAALGGTLEAGTVAGGRFRLRAGIPGDRLRVDMAEFPEQGVVRA